MQPPKYNFYLGKAVKPDFFKGLRLNNLTGLEENNSAYYSSAKVDSAGYKFLYVFCQGLAGTEVASAIFYKADGSYNGYANLSSYYNAINRMIAIPADTAKIAFCYPSNCLEALAYIENKELFIYLANSCVPHYKALNKKLAKENNQAFFRTSLDGKVSFYKQDYTFIEGTDIEGKLLFAITKDTLIYYKGTFSKTDCSLDLASRYAEIKVDTLDSYKRILDKYDNTYDLIKLAPAISQIDLHKRAVIQVYVKGGKTISNYIGGTYWEDDVLEVVDDDRLLTQKYHFGYINAGNEFEVKDADDPKANGLYAGVKGLWINRKTGYKCTFSVPGWNQFDYIYIKDENDKILYRSNVPMTIEPDADPSDPQLSGPVSMHKVIWNEDGSYTIDRTGYTKIDNVVLYHLYARGLCDVDAIQTSDSEIALYDVPIDDFTDNRQNYKKCIGLEDIGQFYCTSQTSVEPTRFGQNDYGDYFTNNFVAPLSTYRPLPICRSTWVNTSLWFVYSPIDQYKLWESLLRKKYTLKDSFSLADIIKVLLREIDPSLQHEATKDYSRFLYDSDIPNFSMLKRFYVYLTPKSNILKGEYDQPAQKAEITLKSLMDMLRDCFRCYWYIEDNRFKIEHISFFLNGGAYAAAPVTQLDFTTLRDQFNRKLTQYFQSKIAYDKNSLAARYEFDWPDNATELFSGPAVDVLSNYVKTDLTENISPSSFAADVDFMLANPNDFSSDGFALLCPILTDKGRLELPIVQQDLFDVDNKNYTGLAQNFYASWKYMLRFYMFDMPAKTIKINEGIGYIPENIKFCMEHDIAFPLEWDPDELNLIKTTIGSGTIKSISINIDTRLVKTTLSYKPK